MSDEKISKLKQATHNDPVLSELLRLNRDGWPLDKKQLDENLKCYFNIKHEIYVDDGILFFKDRIIIPYSMKSEIRKKCMKVTLV